MSESSNSRQVVNCANEADSFLSVKHLLHDMNN